jgi:transposase
VCDDLISGGPSVSELDLDTPSLPHSSTRSGGPPLKFNGPTDNLIEQRVVGIDGLVARLALNLTARCRELTVEIDALETEITALVEQLAPSLLAICGCGPLTAAKIVGETAGVERFRNKDAFARHNGTAPLPVWSSNKARHRLSRTGNRQLNAALHRIAITQAHWHPEARALLARRKAGGDGGLEAIRVLKRRLSDVVYRALLTDANSALAVAA